MTNYKTGLWAEFLAAAFLAMKGYRILKLRAKTPVGEIDVLARKGNTLVAIEVKTSKNFDRALYRVDALKQQRVSRALQWLMTHKSYTQFVDVRFDVIALAPARIYHIINAW